MIKYKLVLILMTSHRMEMVMGLFDVDEVKLQAYYHRAWLECNRGYVDPRKYPYLDKALYIFCPDAEQLAHPYGKSGSRRIYWDFYLRYPVHNNDLYLEAEYGFF